MQHETTKSPLPVVVEIRFSGIFHSIFSLKKFLFFYQTVNQVDNNKSLQNALRMYVSRSL